MLFQVWFHLDEQFTQILNESFAWHFHNHQPPERQAITVNCSHAATDYQTVGNVQENKQTKQLQKEHINPIPKKVWTLCKMLIKNQNATVCKSHAHIFFFPQ